MTKVRVTRQYQTLKLVIFVLTFFAIDYLFSLSSVLWKNNLSFSGGLIDNSPILAQTLTPEKVSDLVYLSIPDLPLENNYLSTETKQPVTENTFITRLVRYHQFTKSRPTVFRLDWKLTLADYLGKNEAILDNRYPGSNTLTENPISGDKKVIESLSQQQRDKLVEVLVKIYNPNASPFLLNNSSDSPSNVNNDQNNTPNSIKLPQPGAADLLLP